MRFVLAAAVAAFLCAGQASATTWVSYLAGGTGYSRVTDSVGGDIQPPVAIDFTLTFSLPAGETEYDPIYPYQDYTFNGATPGTLAFSYLVGYPSGSFSEYGTINYDDADSAVGFPTALASNAATGSLLIRSVDFFGNNFSTVEGMITSFIILGEGQPFDGVHLATAPVPEPMTWAMMLVGLGAVGYALRRRPRHDVSPATQPV